eukprot:1361770-Amorphochlora_amoeboformis.AAC.1
MGRKSSLKHPVYIVHYNNQVWAHDLCWENENCEGRGICLVLREGYGRLGVLGHVLELGLGIGFGIGV